MACLPVILFFGILPILALANLPSLKSGDLSLQ